MKATTSLLFLIVFTLAGLDSCQKRERSVHHRMVVIPGATRQRGKVLFLALPAVYTTRQLACFLSSVTLKAALTRPSAPEHSLANTADGNTATGAGALLSNTTGFNNTASGTFALFTSTTGAANTANGESALLRNTTGSSNTAIGAVALVNNTTGGLNTANGVGALNANSTGNSNTALGQNAGNGITTASNVIAIGASGANVNNSCFIGHIRGVQTSIGDAIPVLIDSAGQLGTMSSSRRFKTDIKPIGNCQ